MSKQKTKKSFINRLKAAPGLMVAVILVAGGSTFGVAYASCNSITECQEKINQQSSEKAHNQSALGVLASKANSYKATINKLQDQIVSIENAIANNQTKQSKIQAKIDAAQKKLDQQKAFLRSDLKAMYVNGQMSTIEMLATSKNLSNFVDAETYRGAVQTKLQDTMDQISKLENQLNEQKQKVQQLIKTEESQRSRVAAAKAQQDKLLSYNASQQAAYNAKINANNQSITSLRNRLIALNTTSDSQILASGTCGGGYPRSAPNKYGAHWGCSYGQDNTVDSWGMLNRECVSYTAFMVHEDYVHGYVKHNLSSGYGDAYQWIAGAENAGVPVSTTPQVGDVAIRDRDWAVAGDVGHAMYVLAVNGSQITVGEYNENYDGTYDERTFNYHNYAREHNTQVYFLHFREW